MAIPSGLGYIRSIPFFLKIAAFIVLLIGIGTLGTFLNEANKDGFKYTDGTTYNSFDHWGKKDRLNYGMIVIVVSWLIVIALVALFIFGHHEKITVINWPLTVAINMVIWAVLLFIAGCVIADTARVYDDKLPHDTASFCDFLKTFYFDTNARCGHLVGATVCCFITAIIFGVDAFFNFMIFRGKSVPAAGPPAVPT